jgi:hypothetical protein
MRVETECMISTNKGYVADGAGPGDRLITVKRTGMHRTRRSHPVRLSGEQVAAEMPHPMPS